MTTPPRSTGTVDDLREFDLGVGWIVAAVAVCRLDHQIVGLPHDGRRKHHRISRTPEVPGEHNAKPAVLQLDKRGTQDMAGTRKAQYQSVTQIDVLVEGNRGKLGQAALCVVLGVERQCGRVLRETAPVCKFRLFLVQVPRIRKEDFAQVPGGAAAVNLAPKTVLHE